MMVRLFLICFICVVFLSSCSSSSKRQGKEEAIYYLKGLAARNTNLDKKVCILAAGQSNIDGRVAYALMPEYLKKAQPLKNTFYVKNDIKGQFAPIDIKDEWAFDLVTYYHFSEVVNDDLYIIKWTEGGTSIDSLGDSERHWTAEWEHIERGGGYSLLRQFEKEILEHIARDGKKFEIRCLLWHQGEGDRGNLETGCEERYYVNLKNVIAYIRGLAGNINLPVITGTISHRSEQYDATIEKAQKRLASEDPYFFLIDMSGATLMDSYHFDAKSSVYFGEMCYDMLIEAKIVKGNKLNPKRPW